MEGKAISVHALVNKTVYGSIMIDTGLLCYSFITPSLVKRAGLQCLNIKPRFFSGVGSVGCISQIAKFDIDIEGFKDQGWAYVVKEDFQFDMMLGRPWMDRLGVTIAPKARSIYVHSQGKRIRILSKEGELVPHIKGRQPTIQISATAFGSHIQSSKKGTCSVFAASLADIEKALAVKPAFDFREQLPEQYHHHEKTFDPKTAAQMPPLRGPNVDHHIEFIKKDGKEPEAPWGPLYNMSRGELLVLRKELTSLLDKGWIRVSNSPASAPILFAKKPGGGLWFCVDYRALNAITRKDRYPLPLITETLNNIGKAKWFTKLDVSAAFHKIRIASGDEWKTAFRTRFGLYEWLVTPFGLANAPSTFQRYINSVLQEHIDDFVSAYLDDVIIYTDGNLDEH